MSTLQIQTIVASIEQEFKLDPNRYHIGSLAPYLYMHNAPAGVFTFTLLKGLDILFSKTFTSADIKSSLSTVNNYAHVFYPIIPDHPVQLSGGTYTARISTSGYSPTNSSFMAWIQQFEDLNNPYDYVLEDDNRLPLALRFKVLTEGIE